MVKFSIIIAFKEVSPYLHECLEHIRKQTYKNYEVILLPDTRVRFNHPKVKVIPTGTIGPAQKRDAGGAVSQGDVLAFIDDDAYPDPDWLKNMVKNFADGYIAAVGGPGVTPGDVSWRERASGWFSASILGGGPNTYRFLPYKKRFVDDYPTMNLAIRREDFCACGGFDSHFWPGEDTKLCFDLVYTLGKKIIYDPEVLVYHHRRPVWGSHLRQHGNYGLHRGYFARTLPKTSFRFIYFMPSLLVLGIMVLPKITIPVYAILLLANGIWITERSGSLFQGAISLPVVFLTHVWYGVRFIQGFMFTKQLRS